MIYLSLEDLADIAAEVVDGRQVVVRDVGLLSMSAHRPQTSALGHEPYPGVADKAAALLVAITMNRPLQDGTECLALAAAWVFCGLNCQRQPDLTNDEAFHLVMGVARGELDVPDVASALREAGIVDWPHPPARPAPPGAETTAVSRETGPPTAGRPRFL